MANNNSKQKERLVQSLDIQIKKINSALDSMKESIEAIMVGENDTPFWNGYNAFSILRTSLTQYENDKALLGYINDCKASTKKS